MCDRVAKGGEALGLAPDGRVVFVAGAMPEDRVEVEVVAEHKNRLEAKVTAVVAPSADRVEPPCVHASEGCGGCDWQHVSVDQQPNLRRDIVVDSLRRLAQLDNIDVRTGPVLTAERYRTTVRAAVVGGRAGYRFRSSNNVVVAESCLTAHPLVEEILVEGRFEGASEVVIRVGADTGDRLVLASPTAGEVSVPVGVKVVGQDELDEGKDAYIYEEIAGKKFRISPRSFFQCRPDGAAVLVDLVDKALEGRSGLLLDAYCGVGLFGSILAPDGRVVGVESDQSATSDAVVNYHPAAKVVTASFGRWRPKKVGAAVVDPSRAGLGKAGAATLLVAAPTQIGLVSCDPASLARDAKLLVAAGYTFDWVTTVDLFGHTSHVETVSRFVR